MWRSIDLSYCDLLGLIFRAEDVFMTSVPLGVTQTHKTAADWAFQTTYDSFLDWFLFSFVTLSSVLRRPSTAVALIGHVARFSVVARESERRGS